MSSQAKDNNSSQDAHYARLVVLLFIPVVLLAVALPLLWNVSQQNAESDASGAHYTLTGDEIAALAKSAGHTATGDSVTSILLLVKPEGEAQLSRVALITVDDTQGFAKLLEVDPAAQVSGDGFAETLNDAYASSGTQGVAYAVAHAGIISVDHIVEMDTSSWEIVRGAVEAGSDSLAVDIAQLLEGIKENDMSVRTIRELLTRATSYGFSAESIVEIPVTGGASQQVLAQEQIGLSAGTIS